MASCHPAVLMVLCKFRSPFYTVWSKISCNTSCWNGQWTSAFTFSSVHGLVIIIIIAIIFRIFIFVLFLVSLCTKENVKDFETWNRAVHIPTSRCSCSHHFKGYSLIVFQLNFFFNESYLQIGCGIFSKGFFFSLVLNWILIQDPPNKIFFFCWENALKKLLNIFSSFIFYLKIHSFRLIMENNFIQMAASAGHAVASTIGQIFKHILDCVQLYFTNGFTNIVL